MHSPGALSEHVVSDFYGREQEVLIKWVTEAHSFWILIILKPVFTQVLFLEPMSGMTLS